MVKTRCTSILCHHPEFTVAVHTLNYPVRMCKGGKVISLSVIVIIVVTQNRDLQLQVSRKMAQKCQNRLKIGMCVLVAASYNP